MSYVAAGYAAPGYFGQPGSRAMFQLGTQTLNFEQSPLRPPLDSVQLQAEFASAGGRSFALVPIAEEQTLLLRWPRLSGYQRDRLLDWFFNVAQGMSNSFTYRAPDDTLTTVRLAAPDLAEIREVANQRHAVEVPLSVVP